MTEAQLKTKDIVIDEIFPHAAETIWTMLTSAELMTRWMMQPKGFEAVEGKEFTFQTNPAGAWDGAIRCKVLEVVPNRRLSYAWKGGDDSNVGYGSLLDTIVTFSLTQTAAGTHVRLVHAGFETPRNDIAYKNMSEGWAKCVKRLNAATGEKN